MYLFAAIIFGILLSIFTRASLLMAGIFLFPSIIILAKNKNAKLFIFPILIFAVCINYSHRDYRLKDFSGEVTGKVISSSENKSVLKTSSLNGKKFATKILFYEKLDRGGTYKILGKFTPPLPAMNEGNFDYEKNDKAQGIYALGKINSFQKISEPKGFYKFSNALIERAKKFTDFLVTGLIFFYIVTIGMPISALRAFLFYLLYKANIYLKKDLDLKKIYFLSLSIILFINPMAIYSLSLLMSYGAIFGLVFVYPVLNSRLAGSGLVKKSFVGTSSVIISLFPLINYYFDGFSLLVFIANLIIVPIYSVIITLGFIMGLGIFPGILGKVLNILMNATFGLESLFSAKGSIFLALKAFKFEYIFVYYILLLLILYRHKLREIIEPNLKIIEIYMAVFFVLASLGILRDLNTYKESHLYIGQGDCTLISFRGKNYLIDTGGARQENKIAEKFLFPTLKLRGISKIDGIFISHFDEDHAGNLNKILKKYKVDNIFISHLPEDPEILENAEKFSNIVILKKGDKVKILGDTLAEFISDSENSEEENDNSMVLLINHRGFKTLFTGDISENVERKINRDIDILKVAHHGSKTSTSKEFLENTSPKFALISAGVNNSYGHPHEEVLQNLEKHGIIYYVTARDGQVDFKIYGDKLRVDRKNQEEDYKFYILLIFLNTTLLYMTARKNYELQENL